MTGCGIGAAQLREGVVAALWATTPLRPLNESTPVLVMLECAAQAGGARDRYAAAGGYSDAAVLQHGIGDSGVGNRQGEGTSKETVPPPLSPLPELMVIEL